MTNEKEENVTGARGNPSGSVSRDAETMADAASRVRHAAEDAGRSARHNAESVINTTQRISHAAAGQAEHAMSLTSKASSELASQTRQTLDVMRQCGSVMAEGMQMIWRECMNVSQGAMQSRSKGIGLMMRARTLPDLYAAQNDFLKEEMEILLQGSAKISELSSRMAHEAADKLAHNSAPRQKHTEKRA